MNIGYILALAASLFFSFYIIPRKFAKNSPLIYTFFVGIGFTVFSAAALGTYGNFAALLNPYLIGAGIVGILWMIAQVLYTSAIDKLGISIANQWRTFQGPIGAITALLILGEFVNVNIWMTGAGAVAIFIAAILLTIKKSGERLISKNGIVLACVAAVLFGGGSTIQKYVTMNGADLLAQTFCFAAFVMISGFISIAASGKYRELKASRLRDNLLGVAGGGLYFAASWLQVASYQRAPASIAFTMIQISAVWTVLIGVLYFKEINLRTHWLRICIGMLFAIISVILLMFAQG